MNNKDHIVGLSQYTVTYIMLFFKIHFQLFIYFYLSLMVCKMLLMSLSPAHHLIIAIIVDPMFHFFIYIFLKFFFYLFFNLFLIFFYIFPYKPRYVRKKCYCAVTNKGFVFILSFL